MSNPLKTGVVEFASFPCSLLENIHVFLNECIMDVTLQSQVIGTLQGLVLCRKKKGFHLLPMLSCFLYVGSNPLGAAQEKIREQFMVYSELMHIVINFNRTGLLLK